MDGGLGRNRGFVDTVGFGGCSDSESEDHPVDCQCIECHYFRIWDACDAIDRESPGDGNSRGRKRPRTKSEGMAIHPAPEPFPRGHS
jgi:hypothetical protein